MIATALASLSALNKRSTWITLLVIIGVVFAGYAITSYVHAKSEAMSLKVELSQSRTRIEQLERNNKANVAAIATRNELVTALAKVETVERVKTVQALKANPAWASQPIPADVLASLRD